MRQEMSVAVSASDPIGGSRTGRPRGARDSAARRRDGIVVRCRRARQRKALVFCSCRDTFLSYRCLSLAVQIVDRLAQSDVNAEGVAKMLRSCAGKIESPVLQPRTLEMIETAERRGIPWHRVSVHMRHVQLG